MNKIEPKKVDKNKLVLAPSAMSTAQILRFAQKTPKDYIYKRPAKGGGEWEYVSIGYIRKTLNFAFGWMWCSEVKELSEHYNQITALVRLSVLDKNGQVLIWKEDAGRADIKISRKTKEPLDYGNDQKAAISDGIKRCAAQLGIASDIYGKEEFKELDMDKIAKPEIPVSPDDDKKPTQMQIDLLKKKGVKTMPETQREAKEMIAEILEDKK